MFSARDGTRLLAPLRDDSDDDSYVTETDSEADESELDDGEEVLRWLEGLKLEQFYDEFEEAGYDTMEILKGKPHREATGVMYLTIKLRIHGSDRRTDSSCPGLCF